MRALRKALFSCAAALVLCTLCARAEDVANPAGIEFFESRIRPVLVENCYKCHSAQSEKLKGGLRLDSRAGLLKGGDSGAAITPGEPAGSLLVEAIKYNNEDLQMPPKKKLSERQIADLEQWVKTGAPWPAGGGGAAAASAKTQEAFDLKGRAARHWAWQPVKAVQPPAVRNQNWVTSPIDAFILAELEKNALTPAAPADKRTLIRRVTYDLIGLPPTPEEVSAFLADDSPAAYEKVVERLLASPHYGERWGRHWLDLVRYAETGGHEFDYEYPLAWHYRDYIVRAFNADVPYNQFVTEHIAGDLLEEPRRHPAEKFNESVIATGFWFLHESLHSPVDIREDEALRVDNQIDVFSKAFSALTVSCARCHDHKFDAISTKDYYALAGYLQSSRYDEAFIDAPAKHTAALEALKQARADADGIDAGVVTIRAEHEPSQPAFESFDQTTYKDWFTTGHAFADGPINSIAHSGCLSVKLQGTLGSQTFEIKTNKIAYRIAGKGAKVNVIIDGFQRIREPIYGGLTFTINSPDKFVWHIQDVSQWKGHRAYIEFLDYGDEWVAVDEILFCEDKSATKARGEAPALPPIRSIDVDKELPTPTRVIAIADGTGEDERIFIRGNHKTLGEVAPRQFLEAIAGAEQSRPQRGSGRLDLARRIVDLGNPLTARVMVNRIWKHHFGEGIVRSVDDFGVMGQPPSHPALLDYLATEFIRRGWSIKKLHRLMVLSSTYRMASAPCEQAGQSDPQNRLLSHMPVRRLEAEAIRDSLLAISGRLDRTIGGPSILPHLTPFMNGRGKPATSGPADGNGRRSIYISVRRNFLTPMLTVFDYPVPFSTVGRRNVSHVPAQALLMMNNPLVAEQAKLWSKRVMESESTSEARIRRMYNEAFAREPDANELKLALEFIRDESSRRNESIAWSDLAHVLFCNKEFIFLK